MKNYILPLLAVALAIGLSSYSTSSGTQTDEQALYWYPVQTNNTIDHNSLINPSSSTPLTKTELRDAGLIPCPEAEGVDCIRGFETVQMSDVSSPGNDFTQKAL